MVKDLKKNFIAIFIGAIFALLVLVLGAINIVNFAIVTSDADEILSRIENGRGVLLADEEVKQDFDGNGPMGPSSPETSDSVRYFTVKISPEGEATILSFEINAVRPEDAIEWANGSLKNGKSGWSRRTYRYKTYTFGEDTFVSVIDFSRELRPAFTALYASIIGLIGGLIICFAVLFIVYDRLVFVIARGDDRQKKSIFKAANELKAPITAIALEKETIKEKYGESESTRSIEIQLKKLTELTLKLNELSAIESEDPFKKEEDLSILLKGAVEEFAGEFERRSIKVKTEIEDGVRYSCDADSIKRAFMEVLANGAAYSESFFELSLSGKDNRIKIVARNDATGLPEGDQDRLFEKFYKASPGGDGKGLGLYFVRAVVENHGGRVNAKVENGVFRLKIEL